MSQPTGDTGRRRYVERARAGMREAVLTAVDDLVRDRGWQATTMSDIAARAGVSRPTVYQLFESRDGLAQAYLLRQTELFMGSVEDAIRADGADPMAAVTAGLHAFLAGAGDNGMVKAILSGEDNDGLLPLVTTRGLPVIRYATDRLVAVIEELWPRLAPPDVRVFAESVVRLAISHATAAGQAPDRAVDDVTHLLRPFVERAFAQAHQRP
jgi:AcrR family transcriptional regulator